MKRNQIQYIPPPKNGRSADQYIDQPAYKFCAVNDFFTNSVVTMSIVVGSIFLSSDYPKNYLIMDTIKILKNNIWAKQIINV